MPLSPIAQSRISVYAPVQNSPPPRPTKLFLRKEAKKLTFTLTLVKLPYNFIVIVIIYSFTPLPFTVTIFVKSTYYREKPKGGIPYGSL